MSSSSSVCSEKRQEFSTCERMLSLILPLFETHPNHIVNPSLVTLWTSDCLHGNGNQTFPTDSHTDSLMNVSLQYPSISVLSLPPLLLQCLCVCLHLSSHRGLIT